MPKMETMTHHYAIRVFYAVCPFRKGWTGPLFY